MLIITRTPSEAVIIQIPGRIQPVRVQVAKIRGNHVTLGFEGETAISIDREEVYKRKEAQGLTKLEPDYPSWIVTYASALGCAPDPKSVDDAIQRLLGNPYR